MRWIIRILRASQPSVLTPLHDHLISQIPCDLAQLPHGRIRLAAWVGWLNGLNRFDRVVEIHANLNSFPDPLLFINNSRMILKSNLNFV